MILTTIIALIILFIVSVRFSAKQLAQEKRKYYGRFIAINFLAVAMVITGIYYLTRNDEKPVRFLLLTLGFMSTQILVVLIIGLIVKFSRERKKRINER